MYYHVLDYMIYHPLVESGAVDSLVWDRRLVVEDDLF